MARRRWGTGGLELRGKTWYLRHRKFGKPVGVTLRTGDRREAERLARIMLAAIDEELIRRKIHQETNVDQYAELTAWEQAQKQLEAMPEGSEREDLLLQQTENILDILGTSVERQREKKRQQDEALAEAERLARERVEMQRQLAQLEADNPTVDAFFSKYIEFCKAKDRSPATIRAYQGVWNLFIADLQATRINDVTQKLAVEYIERRRTQNLSAQTMYDNIAKLKTLFSYAVKKGYCRGSNPFAAVPMPRLPRKRVPKFLTAEQITRLLEAARSDECTTLFILLGVHAGLRKGEILNMRWEEIDFEQRLIHVRCKAADAKRGIVEFRTKSKTDRVVPLKEVLRDALMPLRKEDGYLIIGQKTTGIDRQRYAPKGFREAVMKAGLSDCTPHVLRHTFASLAIQSGKVDLYQVKEWLGHANIEMTQIYAHLLPYNKSINEF